MVNHKYAKLSPTTPPTGRWDWPTLSPLRNAIISFYTGWLTVEELALLSLYWVMKEAGWFVHNGKSHFVQGPADSNFFTFRPITFQALWVTSLILLHLWHWCCIQSRWLSQPPSGMRSLASYWTHWRIRVSCERRTSSTQPLRSSSAVCCLGADTSNFWEKQEKIFWLVYTSR